MPIDYVIENERVITVGKGVVTFQEIYQMAMRQIEDPAFRSEFDELLDLTEAEKLQLSKSELQELADISPFDPNSRRAFAASDDLAFGLTRMYQVFQEPTGAEVCIFRNLVEATKWFDEKHGVCDT